MKNYPVRPFDLKTTTLLSIYQVAQCLGCSAQKVSRMAADPARNNDFPTPRKMGGLTKWRTADILEWIDRDLFGAK